MPERTYSDINRDELKTFASSEGHGYDAADQFTDIVESELETSLIDKFDEAGIHAMGMEFAVAPPMSNHEYSNLSGSIPLGAVWLNREMDDTALSFFYLGAIDGSNGPEAVRDTAPSGAGGTTGWSASGSFFVAHYSGNADEIEPADWKDAAATVPNDAGDTLPVVVGTEFMIRALDDDQPQLQTSSAADAWFGFGTEITVSESSGTLNVSYENGRYSHFRWLLDQLEITPADGDASPAHQFAGTGDNRVPKWEPNEDRSGSFSLGSPPPGLEVYGGDPLYNGVTYGDVSQLQADLWELGFWFTDMVATAHAGTYGHDPANQDTLTAGHASGDFGEQTAWALREFQIYASQETVAVENQSAGNYVGRLQSTANTRQYEGKITGVLDDETAKCIQHWLDNDLRCPVVVEARTQGSGSDYVTLEFENLWRHDDDPDPSHRMFLADIAGSMEDSNGNAIANSPNVRSFTPDGRVVIGDYGSAGHGGPRSVHDKHTWDAGELTPENLIGEARTAMGSATESTYKAIRAVADVECYGFFDVINAWDSAVQSAGPYHWTLRAGFELPPYFSYVKSADRDAFDELLGSRGVDVDTDWDGGVDSMFNDSQRKYSDDVTLRYHAGGTRSDITSSETLRNVDADYFRTWHWFSRLVHAGRTSDGYRGGMWDMARVRVRDILYTEMPNTTPGGNSVPGTSAGSMTRTTSRIGDIFTSEMAVALLLRWHVKKPAHVCNTDAGTGVTNAFDEAVASASGNASVDLSENAGNWNENTDYGEILANAIFDSDESDYNNGTYATYRNNNLPDWQDGGREYYEGPDWATYTNGGGFSWAATGAAVEYTGPNEDMNAKKDRLTSLHKVRTWPRYANQSDANHTPTDWYDSTLGSLDEAHNSFELDESDLLEAPYDTNLTLSIGDSP